MITLLAAVVMIWSGSSGRNQSYWTRRLALTVFTLSHYAFHPAFHSALTEKVLTIEATAFILPSFHLCATELSHSALYPAFHRVLLEDFFTIEAAVSVLPSIHLCATFITFYRQPQNTFTN